MTEKKVPVYTNQVGFAPKRMARLRSRKDNAIQKLGDLLNMNDTMRKRLRREVSTDDLRDLHKAIVRLVNKAKKEATTDDSTREQSRKTDPVQRPPPTDGE